jgi:cytidylate kinase
MIVTAVVYLAHYVCGDKTMKQRLVITVDGPAGVGKSTVSKEVARRMMYLYLDTGALYRAIAYRIKHRGIALDDERQLGDVCEKIKISLTMINDGMAVYVDGEDVTGKIRTEEMGLLASRVSAVPVVRKALLPLQRRAAVKGGIVAEGRDMGTVVFPGADIKFFLLAHVDQRTDRRCRQLSEQGMLCDYGEVQRWLEERDAQDRGREIAPLKPADDAIMIDTTHMDVTRVVLTMMTHIGKNCTIQGKCN